MSTLPRTLRNLWKIGFKEYGHQMQYMGDTKSGTFIGIDRYGNKFYENREELPIRTRWVDYKERENDVSQIEPGWRAWISHTVDAPPTVDPVLLYGTTPWQTPDVRPNYTLTRGAFRTYNTAKPKVREWEPVAVPR